MKTYIVKVDGFVIGKMELSREEVKLLDNDPGVIVIPTE